MPFHKHAIGINRRELLQVGYSGAMGLGLMGLPTMPALARPADGAVPSSKSAKSMILIFLTGAPSHIDTFDPKPDAPAEIRGQFSPIQTAVPGLVVTELLPQLAARADKYAVVRTLAHKDNNHLVATHHVLTGQKQPGAFFDKIASRDDWPAYSAALNYLRPQADGLPSGVNVPTFLMAGPLVWPGQHGGFLGPRHDPWQINQDPNAKEFKVENLSPGPGLDVNQLDDRKALLDQVNRGQEWLSQSMEGRRMSDQQDRAFSVLTSGCRRRVRGTSGTRSRRRARARAGSGACRPRWHRPSGSARRSPGRS